MSQPSTMGQPNRAVRLTFTYEGVGVLSVSRQTLDLRALPSDPIPDAQTKERQSGFWFEVHNRAGQTIYRRVVQNPMGLAVEVHNDVPDGSYSAKSSRWQPINERRGTFSVVVPYVEPGTSVHLFSSPLGPEMRPEPAREMASFPIAEEGSGQEELR